MKSIANLELTDDIEQLKTLLKEKLLAEQLFEKSLQEKTQQIDILQEMVRYLKQLKFGRSSEKFTDIQSDLFNEAEELVELEGQLETELIDSPLPAQKRKNKRKPRTLQMLPDDIPRVEVFHDLTDEEKVCSCGCMMAKSGAESSEQLEVVPPQFTVKIHTRHTYSCQQCKGRLKTANKPPQMIEKSFSSPSLLAYIIVSKYLYALPLYRQESIYKSLNVPLKRNTMASWIIKTSHQTAPLLERFERYLLRENYLQCDESRLQVLNEPDRDASQLSQMWVRRSMGETPIILFDYSASRSGDQACDLLKGLSGYLQTDDYAGYNQAVKKNNLTQLGCNAHGRRKFSDAKKAEPQADKELKEKKLSGSDIALLFYKKLYKIEAEIKNLPVEERFQTRLIKSVPLMMAFVGWAEKRLLSTPKKSKLGVALRYLIRNQEKLIQYCGHGKLNIDNNLAENAIRPFVIGRKNWLFSNSVAGAKASAGLYSLVETAKANGLNVFDYLKHIFNEIPKVGSEDELDALLPWNVNLPD
jgi:transposase